MQLPVKTNTEYFFKLDLLGKLLNPDLGGTLNSTVEMIHIYLKLFND